MKRFLPLLLLLASALSATAHPAAFQLSGSPASAQAGFLHPMTGLDHLLAMVAVGLWAVRLGGCALWILPFSFVLSMSAGAFLGLGHAPAIAAEHGITASLLLLGTALGLAWKPSLTPALAVAAASGLSHGYAHGTEMPVGFAPLLFLIGMVGSTALLHAVGVATGTAIGAKRRDPAFRFAGAGMVLFVLMS